MSRCAMRRPRSRLPSAVNINPALPASWNTLQILYDMTGQTAQSEKAAAHVATLANLPHGDRHREQHVLRRRIRTRPSTSSAAIC